MGEVSTICPLEPHEMDKRQRSGMDDIVRRIAAQSAVRGNGNDLLLRIYLAGIYHGVELSRPTNPRQGGEKA